MLVNRSGDILYHYYMPISALTLLLFSSLSTVKKYRHVFLTVVTLSLLLNMQDAVKHIQLSSGIIGKHEDSWRFLSQLSDKLYATEDNSYGVFVYSPDVVGYEPRYAVIYGAEKYKKAVSHFEKKPVTYLDYMLPNQNGVEIAKKLKGKTSTKNIPVIMISANHNADAVLKQAPIDDFIPKPFELDNLINKIHTHIQ